jgi:YcaO-like protein with predicted kinase domain
LDKKLECGIADVRDMCGLEYQQCLDLSGTGPVARTARQIGISRLANITGLDVVGIPTVAAIRPSASSLCVSQGKGAYLESAVRSAVMEATELHFAERCRCEAQDCTVAQIGKLTMNLDSLRKKTATELPADQEISWLIGHDLLSKEESYVPLEAVDMDQRVPDTRIASYFTATSTGLAAGFSRPMVIAHALSEVIERDAHSLWRQAPLEFKLRGLIDPETVDDQVSLHLVEKFRRAGYAPCFWDMSSDLGVPAFIAEFFADIDGGGFYWPYSIGTGCDVSPRRALRKAILEAAQIRLTYIAGARDDLTWDDYSDLYEDVAASRRSLARTDLPRRPFTADDHAEQTAEDALSHLVRKLAANRLCGVVAIDLAPREKEVEVFKVMVPGLEDCTEPADGDLSAAAYDRLARIVSKS